MEEDKDFLRENIDHGSKKRFALIFVHKPGTCSKVRTSAISKGEKLATPWLQRREKADGERALDDPKEGKQPPAKRTTFRAIEPPHTLCGGECYW